MNLFLQYFGGRGPTRWGPATEDKGRGPRFEEHKHPIKYFIFKNKHI